MQQEGPSGNQSAGRSRHGGHRERIFTEPVMDVLIEQLGQHYYRIRDHLEKPQAVVTEIADYINKKIPGLNLQPMQVYGRMINLQNSLRRYWDSIAVGDYKKKPRYYDVLCKVFGADYNNASGIHNDFINGSDDLDNNSPNHITVELPEFFDSNPLVGSGQYTTTSTAAGGAATTFRASAPGNGREEMWTPQLTNVLLEGIQECIGMLRSRPDKYKAWKVIAGSVNAHCEDNPLTLYQIKVKVKRMLAAVRKYERQASTGQLFVDKPFFYDAIKTLFKKELKPYHRTTNSTILDGIESFNPRRPASALTSSMQTFMRRTTSLLEESVQLQKEMREEMKDYHNKLLEQFKTFNDTYRMVAVNSINAGGGGHKRKRQEDDDDEYEEVEELMGDDPSDIEEGIVEQDEYEEIQSTNTQHSIL